MLQIFAPVAQLEERDASNVEGAGSSPARSANSNCARRQVAKAPDCKSGIREFESHRALQFEVG